MKLRFSPVGNVVMNMNSTTNFSEENVLPNFELALVMAGAISAGAYTGGVLDFLLHALDTWQAAKDRQDPDAPPHAVNIRALSGASAGGISAGLLATLVTHEFPAASANASDLSLNPLYQTWVKQIDIAQLLTIDDLHAGEPVHSLLNAQVLDRTADALLSAERELKQRPYFDTSLHVFFSVTNLRGVPYGIGFQGDQAHCHHLMQHADYVHFIVGTNALPDYPDAVLLDPFQLNTPEWDLLKQSTLATSAFPLGLAPRVLSRPLTDYQHRRLWIPTQVSEEAITVAPMWPSTWENSIDTYTFLSVDGGIVNNEPLELAHDILTGDRATHNPRQGTHANRALLLIDPFPDGSRILDAYQPEQGLFTVFGSFINMLKQQVRFKPEELALAFSDSVYSRFLIAPARGEHKIALAGSAFNGFSGFLAESFRAHDFQLGRRNCQRFLQRYFMLPADNPLFAQWSPALREKYQIIAADGTPHLPIIPLLDSANIEVPEPTWPKLSAKELKQLQQRLGTRFDALAHHFLAQESSFMSRLLGRLGWRFFARRYVLNNIISLISKELANRNALD